MIVKNREMILYLLFACNAVIIMSAACADQRERERERERERAVPMVARSSQERVLTSSRSTAVWRNRAAAPPREADAHGGIPGRGSDAGQAARASGCGASVAWLKPVSAITSQANKPSDPGCFGSRFWRHSVSCPQPWRSRSLWNLGEFLPFPAIPRIGIAPSDVMRDLHAGSTTRSFRMSNDGPFHEGYRDAG